MFGELAKIKLLFERLAEKPAVTVDEDYPECLFPIAGTLDHLLEGRSAIVPGGSAVFDKLCGHGEALGTAPGFQLAALVGNRKVVLSLTARRDPHVERGAPGNGVFRIWRVNAMSHMGQPSNSLPSYSQ